MTVPLEIAWSSSNGAVRLSLSGELDMSSGPQFEDALRRAESERSHAVVVDLRGLEFMDSTGLNLLLRAQLRARDSKWRLVVVRGPEAVQRVFTIGRLERKLLFVDDPAEVTDD